MVNKRALLLHVRLEGHEEAAWFYCVPNIYLVSLFSEQRLYANIKCGTLVECSPALLLSILMLRL